VNAKWRTPRAHAGALQADLGCSPPLLRHGALRLADRSFIPFGGMNGWLRTDQAVPVKLRGSGPPCFVKILSGGRPLRSAAPSQPNR
jgi:hypothetical protein